MWYLRSQGKKFEGGWSDHLGQMGVMGQKLRTELSISFRRRERLPTPVFLPGEFHGLYSPWGCKELDTTEHVQVHVQLTFMFKFTFSDSRSLVTGKEQCQWVQERIRGEKEIGYWGAYSVSFMV